MRGSNVILFALILTLCFGIVSAEPVIMLDDGGIATDPYRQSLRAPVSVPDFGGQWVNAYNPMIQRNPENLSVWLPLVTRKLSPKRITREKIVNFGELDAPICIIGSDPLSREWIRLHLDSLIRLKARCWLVQANNFDDFKAMSALLQGKVLMTPADGDAIADFFGILHYPVFIDQGAISQ